MSSVTTHATYKVNAENRNRVLSALSRAAEKTIAEPGNLYFHALQSNDNTICLIEGWESEEALELHRSSEHYHDILLEQVIPYLENRVVRYLTPLYDNYLS